MICPNDIIIQIASSYVTFCSQESRYTKLEKADILEMTVQHLKQKHQRRESHDLVQVTSSENENAAVRFRTGYVACAQEVQRCLGVLPLDSTQKARLGEHLSDCLRKMQSEGIKTAQSFGNEASLISRTCRSSSLSSSSSSMTSSPPASPNSFGDDAAFSSRNLVQLASSTKSSEKRFDYKIDSKNVTSVNNAASVVPMGVVSWPTELPANTNNNLQRSYVQQQQQQQQQIHCSPLYLSSAVKSVPTVAYDAIPASISTRRFQIASNLQRTEIATQNSMLPLLCSMPISSSTSSGSPSVVDASPRSPIYLTVDITKIDNDDIPVLSPKLPLEVPCSSPVWRPW